METVWQFKTANFRVTLECAPDDLVDLSWDDTGETRENLESGLWTVFQFKVAVYDARGNEIAADYLGGSIYENASDFRDHIGLVAKSRADGCNYGSYFADMVRNTIGEARRTWNEPRAQLRPA